ncbi:MAG: GGDEF domain-containing protein [Candidatus Yonathbacteria bacterium]|nr:GGDEF domain-containing protein [Candidatus Yonathbacteria bacterium]
MLTLHWLWPWSRINALEEQARYLMRLSTHDPLTGLLNRRGGDEVLAHHFSMLSRNNCEKNDFAVLDLDLDRFSGINDKYGHSVGDQVLVFFTKVLVGILRNNEHDIVVRLGGDEFRIILPECSFEHGEIVKTKIKDALMATAFEVSGIKLSLRTSVGVATARTPRSNEVRQIEEILKLADKAMYEDKAAGYALRNSEER